MEKQIAVLEAEMAMTGFFSDPERGLRAGEQHNTLHVRLEELYGDWENLAD